MIVLKKLHITISYEQLLTIMLIVIFRYFRDYISLIRYLCWSRRLGFYEQYQVTGPYLVEKWKKEHNVFMFFRKYVFSLAKNDLQVEQIMLCSSR